MRQTALLLSLATILVLWGPPVRAQVSSTFDADLDGWKINGDNSAVWQSTGGNPGGCLDVNDLAIGALNWAIAPRKFLGNWSSFTLSDSICFDVYQQNTSGGAWLTVKHVRIEGPYGVATANDPSIPTPPSQGTWLSGKIAIDPAYWTIESGDWAGLLTNVTSVRVFAEWVNGAETTWLDNIRLTATPASVFTACLADTFNTTDLGDWSFAGAGTVTNPGSGGNTGGFAQVGDKTGVNSYGFVPSKFLGDWSPLEGTGYLTVDIRILSAAGSNEGSPDFIRISGPGGAAHVSLASGDLSMPPRVWKTFVFAIDQSDWIIDSGSWAALIQDVEECRIDLEYFDGTDLIGLDNFGRRMDSCPPIDDAVTIHDPEVSRCGTKGLIGISTVALNPMDGELYGLIRTTTGGLCKVSGPTAGVFIQTYDTPAHLVFTPNGDAFVSLDYPGTVYRKAWGGTSSLWVSGFHDGDDDPYGFAIAPVGFSGPNVNPGDILVSDRGNGGPDQIWSFSPTVAETELLVMADPGEVDQFDLAAGIGDTVYVSDALDPNHIYVLHANGSLGSFALTPAIASPYSVVYDPVAGDLYVASATLKSVHRVKPNTGTWSLVADGFSAFDPCCLEIDAARRRLYVADRGYSRVYELCLEDLTGIEDQAPLDARRFGLDAFPNPFNPAVNISFTLDEAADVRLDVYDAAGRHVSAIKEGRMKPGAQRFIWSGRDMRGVPVAAGVYFVKIEALGAMETRKIVLVH